MFVSKQANSQNNNALISDLTEELQDSGTKPLEKSKAPLEIDLNQHRTDTNLVNRQERIERKRIRYLERRGTREEKRSESGEERREKEARTEGFSLSPPRV